MAFKEAGQFQLTWERQRTDSNDKMTETSEISDNDFKVALIKMLQKVRVNTPEKNKAVGVGGGCGQKRSQQIKNQMEILGVKNLISKRKNSLNGLTRRMEMTKGSENVKVVQQN